MKPVIYFYLPVFNEQDTVGIFLYRLSEVMRNLRLAYEVFITLDECTDDSAEVVEPYMRRMPLRFIHNQHRVGYGKSLYETIKKVAAKSSNPKRDFFLVLDADFTYDPGILKQMSARIERNMDVFFPSRSSSRMKGVTVARRIAHKLVRPILRFRGIEVKENFDMLATFRGCRVRLLHRNMARLKALAEMGPEISPAACAAVFSLALMRDARNLVLIDLDNKKLRRHKSRFKLFSLLRFLLFGRGVVTASAEIEQQPAGHRQPRRYSNKKGKHSSNIQTSKK